MTDLPDFLAARIYDDEQAAKLFAGKNWSGGIWAIESDAPGDYLDRLIVDCGHDGGLESGFVEHATRWDPARVLLEVEAKRGILLDYMTRRRQAEQLNRAYETEAIYYALPSDLPLRYLALPYRAHPEYSEAWAPPTPGTVETWGRR